MGTCRIIVSCFHNISYKLVPVDCQSLPCQNGGTCVPEYETGYNCTCPDLYHGLHCTST